MSLKMTYFFATDVIFIMFCPINAQEMCVPTKQKGKHNAKIKPKGPNLKLLHQLHFGEHFS